MVSAMLRVVVMIAAAAKQLLCLSNHRFDRSLSVRGSESFFCVLAVLSSWNTQI